VIAIDRNLLQLVWDRRIPLLSAPTRRSVYFWLKRLVDFLMASILLIMLSPLMLLIALLIKLDSRGSAFFRQERMGFSWRGRRRRSFTIYKFRSMYQHCDQNAHKDYVRRWIHGEADGGDGVGKLTHDQRVTKLGQILRKTSLDELPQLWNVIRGDMSLVGPRPVPLYEVAEYEPWHMQRLDATPGITGLWQVKGRGRVSVDEMVSLDIEYINHQTFWLDLKAMLLTIPAIVSGRGAA